MLTDLLVLVFLATLIILPISLVAPNLFSKIYSSTRKKNGLIFGGILALSFVLIGITNPTPEVANSIEKISPTPAQSNVKNIKSVDDVKISITQTPTPTNTPTVTSLPTTIPTIIPTKTTAPTKKVTYSSPTPIPATSTPMSIPTNPPVIQSSGYACNCSKTCTQITSCEEAQFQLNSCGCGVRDNDGDGIACDSAPLNCQN